MENNKKIKNAIKNSIKKIENMIKGNRDKKEIYEEKEKLDMLLEEYLKNR